MGKKIIAAVLPPLTGLFCIVVFLLIRPLRTDDGGLKLAVIMSEVEIPAESYTVNNRWNEATVTFYFYRIDNVSHEMTLRNFSLIEVVIYDAAGKIKREVTSDNLDRDEWMNRFHVVVKEALEKSRAQKAGEKTARNFNGFWQSSFV